MFDENRMMIERQAQIISELRAEREILMRGREKAQAEVERTAKAAKFYFELQEAIIENPILQGEWDRFCSFLKLTIADSDTSKRFTGE